ncbi:hypothetical protein ABIC16_002922 [Sphingomonas sp. PvP055]
MIATLLDEAVCKTALYHPTSARLMQPLVSYRLSRPFDEDCAEKCLLLYQNDRLAEPQFSPFVREVRSFRKEGVSIRALPTEQADGNPLVEAAGTILYQPSFDEYFALNVDRVKRLRERNPAATIIFCDWFAPCDIRFSQKVDPFVDGYAKKSLMHERRDYLKALDGHTNLMAYYSQLLQVETDPASPEDVRSTWINPPTILPKLLLTPAFSTSSQLYRLFSGEQRRVSVRDIDVHARIQTKGTGWYGSMRKHASNAISAVPGITSATNGMVKKSQFMAELSRSRLCFSPFGYGELCWRDFEAYAVGAVLLKPDMSHLDVMGDVFRPWETYIPVKWDLSDLDAVIKEALSDTARLEAIADNAYRSIQDTLGFDATRAYLTSLRAKQAVQ